MKQSWSFSFARRTVGTMALLVVFLVSGPVALAQQGSAANEPPTIVLGTVSGDPGRIVGVPLYFKGAENQPVHSAHLEVEFVSNSVKFTKADKGPAASEQDFELAVSAKEAPADANNILRTRISIDVAAAGPDTTKSLPDGILSFLDFDVPTDAKSYSIELRPISFSARNAASAAVELKAEAGKLIVALLDDPLAGCFFFAH